MQEGAYGFQPLQALRQLLLISILAGMAGPWLRAQEIRIRVLNAHNGKPVIRECVTVSIGTWHGADLVAGTNRDGVAVLRLVNSTLVSAVPCPGWPTRASIPLGVNTIAINSGYHVDCQEHARVLPGDLTKPNPWSVTTPVYPIKKILESGITASNTCGRVKVKARPGDLVLFVRSPSLLERLRE